MSPVLQFAHLTCVQAVRDELRGAACIHVLNFDIGMGEQWASVMQELAQLCPATALKVTALVSPVSRHPLELQLIHENLSSFAAELGVFFQFTVFNIDTLDPAALAGGDALAVAVHLPVGAAHAAAMPPSSASLSDSAPRSLSPSTAAATAWSSPSPRTCSRRSSPPCSSSSPWKPWARTPTRRARSSRSCSGRPSSNAWSGLRRHRATVDKAPSLPWRAVFASAGFTPVQASTFAESWLHKVPVRGFRVEKRAPGSLCLFWQRAELVLVSAWRC